MAMSKTLTSSNDVADNERQLGTQQAAALVGVSHPTLIKALDEGKLPYTCAGRNRRIALIDVLDYCERRRDAQYAAIDALSVDAEETNNIEQTLAELRRARKAVAARRRASKSV